jgi:putative CocE/NonD family hydrolase
MTDDQRFAARRPDVLVFQTDTLANDLTVTGNVVADLMTSISTTDADFVVKIIDVFPDKMPSSPVDMYAEKDPAARYPLGGYQMLVHGEIFRGRYRNSYEKPEAFVPNKVTEVKYQVGDIAHTFKKGHRVMVQIQSSWFPLTDRNPQTFVPNIFEAKPSDFRSATMRVFHSAGRDSRLELRVLSPEGRVVP